MEFLSVEHQHTMVETKHMWDVGICEVVNVGGGLDMIKQPKLERLAGMGGRSYAQPKGSE